MKTILIASVALSMCLAGCSKSPLQKLASNNIESDINGEFWTKEQKIKSPLWSKALTYCQQNREKPNCGIVIEIQRFSHGNTELKPYGNSGNYLEAPDI